jgi:ribosomal protein L18E
MLRRQANATVQTNMRIKEKLRRKLEAAAKENQVSFNEEVGRRLAESFQRESLESFLYKIGMVEVAAQSGKGSARTILGSAGLDESETQAPQQEQKKGGKL